MKDWGITLLRLGVMWESVEVAPLQYNYTYLEEVDKLVNKLATYGIYTVVDAHQDLFSRMTCGEGMPSFYVPDSELIHTCPQSIPGLLAELVGACKPMNTYGHRLDELGRPLIEDCLKTSFIKYYPAPEIAASFDILYSNIGGAQDRFIDYWGVVAKYFGENKNVIGFDPINEPWPANFYKDPSILTNLQKFDKEILFPLH
jgi:endoglycosylceramidase